jgi:plasmid replication initiation protein
MENNIVYQENKLIEAHYKQEYTVQEQRTVLWLISEIHKQYYFCAKDQKSFKNGTLRISAQNYANMMGVSVKNIYRDAQKIGKQLMEKVLTIESDTGWKMFHWVASMEYLKNDGIIEVLLSPTIIPYIVELKNYTGFKLENILYLKSSHAIKIYQLLSQYKKIGERIISLNDFRSILGISKLKTYQSYGALKQKILELAKREINKKTDISFSYSEIKKSRKVEAIKFKITSKLQSKTGYVNNEKDFSTQTVTKPSTRALEQAKELVLTAKTGWDLYEIERQFLEYTRKNNKEVQDIDAAFLGFVKKKISKSP